MSLFARFKKAGPSDTDLGTVLLQMHVIDAHQLTMAVSAQKADPSKKLGQVMLAMGIITDEHLREALTAQGKMRNGHRLDAMLEIVQHNFNKAVTPAKPQTFAVPDVKVSQ
jgi:hypothetical protein